ncbi:MAG: cupin domain-containing protein [Pseudomonadota bacterium]
MSVSAHSWTTAPGEQLAEGIVRKGFRGSRIMLVQNILDPGSPEIPLHSHENEQLSICVSGRMTLWIEEVEYDMGPGTLIKIPTNAKHRGQQYGDEPCHIIDVFDPIREDYRHLVAYQDADFADA